MGVMSIYSSKILYNIYSGCSLNSESKQDMFQRKQICSQYVFSFKVLLKIGRNRFEIVGEQKNYFDLFLFQRYCFPIGSPTGLLAGIVPADFVPKAIRVLNHLSGPLPFLYSDFLVHYGFPS